MGSRSGGSIRNEKKTREVKSPERSLALYIFRLSIEDVLNGDKPDRSGSNEYYADQAYLFLFSPIESFTKIRRFWLEVADLDEAYLQELLKKRLREEDERKREEEDNGIKGQSSER